MKLKDIEKLHADGLITSEQKEAVIAHYKLEGRGMSRWLVYSLSSLAAVLIIGGAVLLAKSHWQDITPLAKMSGGLGLLTLCWVAYFALRESKPMAAEAMAVAGAGMWLADIILQGALFEPSAPPVYGCFLFLVGTALIPFLVRQRLLIGVVAITTCVLYTMMLHSEHTWLSLDWMQDEYPMTCLIIGMMLALFWWFFAEKVRGSRGMMRGYSWVGIPAFLGFLGWVQLPLLYDMGRDEGPASIEHGWILYAAAPLVGLLFKPKGTGWFYWLLLVSATCALLPLVEHFTWHPNVIYGLIICAVYAFILMYTGVRSNRISWINYGTLMVIFAFIGLMTNTLKSLEDSGFVLIIAGILLMLISVLVETLRRRLVRKVKSQATQDQPSTPSPSPEA